MQPFQSSLGWQGFQSHFFFLLDLVGITLPFHCSQDGRVAIASLFQRATLLAAPFGQLVYGQCDTLKLGRNCQLRPMMVFIGQHWGDGVFLLEGGHSKSVPPPPL